MAAAYKLKLLSGTLDGVEFSLFAGDTVFCIGRARELHDGRLGATFSQADNVYYVPDESLEGAFLIHCPVGDAAPELRERDAGRWVSSALSLNAVVNAAGLTLAVRREDQAWSDEVLDHRLPALAAPLPGAGRLVGTAPRRRLPLWSMAAAGLLLLMAGAGWLLYERQQPAAQIRTVQAALARSPYQYAVVADRDGHIHAFSDSAEAMAWGQRASHRAQRLQDTYRVRQQEVARLGAVLERTGIDYAVIRLPLPQRPEAIIMAGSGDNEARRKRAAEVLLAQMPYATAVDVRVVSDAQLVEIARSELRARGISTRVDPTGTRASVVNDIFLDDAALYAMSRYRDEFIRQWGDRRIRIRIRLWDDLLKGRSYQYSPDQLLSVGEGRWEFSNAGNN